MNSPNLPLSYCPSIRGASGSREPRNRDAIASARSRPDWS